MPVICPTITAYEPHGYRAQMERVEPFAKRIHIDLMDGEFTPNKSPSLEEIWWSDELIADIHLMYMRPMDHIDALIKLNPSLVIIHFEADVDHKQLAERLHEHDIKAGLALLQQTDAEDVLPIIENFDHALVFSGNLGEHGGEADLQQLDKVRQLKASFPDIELSWDGGINDQNAKQLVEAGVNVLNTGGFIQQAQNPESAYATLKSVTKD